MPELLHELKLWFIVSSVIYLFLSANIKFPDCPRGPVRMILETILAIVVFIILLRDLMSFSEKLMSFSNKLMSEPLTPDYFLYGTP